MFSWGRLILRGGVFTPLVASLLLLLFGVSPAVATGEHTFTEPFGSPGSGAGQFDLTTESSIAIDQSNGNLYVADTANHRVEKFDSTGKFLFAFGWGVKSGDTASAGLDTCTSAPPGCQAGFPGHEPGQFEEPTFIAVDNTPPEGNGDVYVANNGTVGNERQTITLSGASGGEYTLSFTDIIHGTTTTGSNLLTDAWGPTIHLTTGEAISSPGILPPGTTITGGSGGRSFELSADATATAASVELSVTLTSSSIRSGASASEVKSALERLEVLEGNISVSGSSGGPYTIEFIDQLAGLNIRQMACDGSALTPGGAACIAATTVDGFNANSVQKFDSSGNLIAGWGGSPAGGELDGTTCSECGPRPHFEHPSGVAVIPPLPAVPLKPQGSLLVLNSNGTTGVTRATEWTQSSGEFVYHPGTSGVGQPTGIAVDPANHVYLGNGGLLRPPYKIIQTSYCDKEDPFGLCPPFNAGEGFEYHENFTVDPGPDTGVAVDPVTEDVYVAKFNPSDHHSEVVAYDSSHNVLESPFGGNGEIVQSAGVAASGFSGSLSEVYVADVGADRVDVFAPGGPRDVLTVARSGSGLGSVSSVPVGVIACPSLCSTSFPEGEVVALTATAPEHSSFIGWSGGGCAGTGVCQIALTAPTVVTAMFAHATPVLSMLPVSTVTRHTATVRGEVDPEGDSSSCRFEYGPTNGYGTEVPCASHPGSGASLVTVSAGLWDLAAGTTYHYRLVSANSGGTAYGSDETFTTESEGCANNTALCPAQPVETSLTNEGLVFLKKSFPGPTTRTLTNAQKLANALKTCKRQRKKSVRVGCEKQARKKYAPAKKIKKSSHSKKRG
jgi:hypothetical protein